MSDLISRADAKEARPEYRNEDMLDNDKATYNKGWNACNCAWIAIINALPSAEAVSFEDAMEIRNTILFKEYMRGRRDAEAVQGEWVKEEEYGDLWVCDQCGFTNEYMIKFCPICGARMKGGAE